MRRLPFVLLLAALVAATPAGAAGRSGGILPGASAKDPLNIDAGKLDYFEKEQKLIYSGSVIVTNGPSTLKASRLIIFLEGKGSGQAAATTNDRVKHIDAEGPVTLVSRTRSARAIGAATTRPKTRFISSATSRPPGREYRERRQLSMT
jgi:lipopolysaccharide export system protein LptA